MTSPSRQSYRTSELFEEDSISEKIDRNEQEEMDVENLRTVKVAACICGDPECRIPYGFCHCGCGGKAPISPANSHDYGWIKGAPKKFIFPHRIVLRTFKHNLGPFKIDGVYCWLIPLTHGQISLVDDADYRVISTYKWAAVWHEEIKGYYAVRIEPKANRKSGRPIYMHRQILGLGFGDPRQGEHKEPSQTLDNRRSVNLRMATQSQNSANQRLRDCNTSGVKGVNLYKRTGRWRASIQAEGQQFHLGYFNSESEATNAYRRAAIRHFGEFARFE